MQEAATLHLRWVKARSGSCGFFRATQQHQNFQIRRLNPRLGTARIRRSVYKKAHIDFTSAPCMLTQWQVLSNVIRSRTAGPQSCNGDMAA